MNEYLIRDPDAIPSPALIYYRELLDQNLDTVLEIAGGPDRLWPHVKSHKCLEMVKLQMSRGIRRFKCATVAEAEMVCMAGAEAALLAMAPAGPMARRLLALQRAYPKTRILGLVDCEEHLNAYASALEAGESFSLMIDVNLGMDRTGVSLQDVPELVRCFSAVPELHLMGLHCYDGDHHEFSPRERAANVEPEIAAAFSLRKRLQAEGYALEWMIMGGSPTFPIHAKHRDEGVFYSPGTVFLHDMAYAEGFPDLPFRPAAALLCRVLSHPLPGRFTIDCGCKAIASDPSGPDKGVLVGSDHCRPVLQCEEHWVFQMDPGFEDRRPAIGSTVYVIPRHVCPCAPLYPSVLVASRGEIVDEWEITARNRRIKF